GHLERALNESCPPDLTEAAKRTRTAWAKPLGEEAGAAAEVLLGTVEPYRKEIEHHFTVEGHRRFRGLMAGYLGAVTRLKYAGSKLGEGMPFVPRLRGGEKNAAPPRWDLSMFTRACSDVAANQQLDSRTNALANRLLVTADEQGFPVALLSE